MTISTKRFTLNSAGYQDISEGNLWCGFRLTFRSQEANARVRVVLGTSLPDAETQDYDLFEAPTAPGNGIDAIFGTLNTVSRAYARAASSSALVTLTVYRA